MKPRDMKFQRGYIFKAGRAWYGRWRRDEIVKSDDGESRIERKQHCEKLADYGDRYRTKKDVQPLLDEKLVQLNAERKSPEARKSAAASTLSVAGYWKDYFLPFAQAELKPSTVHGYKNLWKMYLGPRLATTIIGDFRCVTATKLLAQIHEEHRLGRATLKHCKALLSSMFRHAKRGGVLDGENPVRDAGIPRAALASRPTHAYSPEDVLLMLDALTGVAPNSGRAHVFLWSATRRSARRQVGGFERQNTEDPFKYVAETHNRSKNSRECGNPDRAGNAR